VNIKFKQDIKINQNNNNDYQTNTNFYLLKSRGETHQTLPTLSTGKNQAVSSDSAPLTTHIDSHTETNTHRKTHTTLYLTN
jgi:hypothetical protein